MWPLSGFYSKDEILLLAYDHNKALFLIGTFTAFLTAFYMGREVYVVFFGKPRDHHSYDHAHESPPVMTLPLVFSGRFCRSSPVGGNKLPEFLAAEIEPAVAHSAFLTYGLAVIPFIGFCPGH